MKPLESHRRSGTARWVCAAALAAVAWFMTGPPAVAQSSDTPTVLDDASTKTNPAPSTRPRLGGASDWFDRQYDEYLGFKKTISDAYNLDFSMDFTIFPQVAAATHAGQPIWLFVYYPSLTWRPFTDTSFGSGQVDVTFGQQAYMSRFNTGKQAASLRLIDFPNDWVSDNFSWSTVAYTHTLPGDMSWLSFTGGQYNLFSFDPNAYAANAQVTFIGYPFAQDATQTFPNAGLGGYAKAKFAGGQFQIAGGVQGATNLSGRAISTRGYETEKLLYWGNVQWKPNFPGLGEGTYSLLVYQQPFIDGVSDRSTGISLSASQALTERYGVFLRINNATGHDLMVRTSYAVGGIVNDPFKLNPGDQAGLALGWDKTNRSNLGSGPRDGEFATELYYNYTLFKALHLTPDVQVFWNPALDRNSSTAAVFTLRTTLSF
jgi:porin